MCLRKQHQDNDLIRGSAFNANNSLLLSTDLSSMLNFEDDEEQVTQEQRSSLLQSVAKVVSPLSASPLSASPALAANRQIITGPKPKKIYTPDGGEITILPMSTALREVSLLRYGYIFRFLCTTTILFLTQLINKKFCPLEFATADSSATESSAADSSASSAEDVRD